MKQLHRTDSRDRSRRGGALVASLIIVVTLVGVAASVFGISLARNREVVQSGERLQSLYMAETGLSESLMQVAVKRKALASRARPGAAQRGGSHRAIAGRRGAVAPPPAQPAAAPPKGRELARTPSPPKPRAASPPKQRFQHVAKSPVSDIPR